jgi:hypothetical protein
VPVDANGAFDLTAPFSASVEWNGVNGDQWVDVWARSTPTFVGTFPVIDGFLQMQGADLSILGEGDHHLIFVGQTSGANQIVSLTLATTAQATTPSNATAISAVETENTANPWWIIWPISGLALLAVAVVGLRNIRRRSS